MEKQQVTFKYINNYVEVFSCLFMHDYYSSRVCNELVIQPTLATRVLIKDYQLIFKPRVGGFYLAANTAKDYSSGVFKESFDLNFEFKFINPHFLAFTALNVDPEIRYFLEDDLKSAMFFGPEFQTDSPTLDRPDVSGILNVKHVLTAPLFPIDGVNSNSFNPRSKVVYLQPRQIIPVYICYSNGPNLDQFDGLRIENEGAFKELITFGPPDQIETRSGLKAFRFASENSLSMKDSWRGHFRLERDNQLGSYRKILPNPSPQSIKYDLTNNTFISENYVKL
jgi:hypothetical protein